jgi:regulator of replication initiation timing
MFYPDGIDSNRLGNTLAQVLGETKEQNKALKMEAEDLRQKLRDAHGDIKVSRMYCSYCSFSALNDEVIKFRI